MAGEEKTIVGFIPRTIFGVFLLLLVLASVILNGITMAVFARINRMFKKYFLGTRALIINLAITDFISVIFYSVPTLVTAFGGGQWLLGSGLCHIQVVAINMAAAMNMHMLTVLAAERCLKFFNPTLHEVIFTDTTMFIVIIGLWIFDFVIGLLPVIGWGAILFYGPQLQCSFDFILSVSFQNFAFIVIFVLPLVAILVLILAVVVKVQRLILAQGRGLGLEIGASGDTKETYITRLVKLQIYLASLPRRKAKKGSAARSVGRRQKVEDPTMDGYGSDSSSDEEITVTTFRKETKKRFKFRRSEYVTALTYLAAGCSIFLCWFFFLVLNFANTHSLTITISGELWLVAVFLTHVMSLIKPVLYFTQNYKFRLALHYGLRPWLFKEGPVDLREEMEASKEKDGNVENGLVTNGFSNHAFEQ